MGIADQGAPPPHTCGPAFGVEGLLSGPASGRRIHGPGRTVEGSVVEVGTGGTVGATGGVADSAR